MNREPPDLENIITIREAAELLGIKPEAVHQAIRRGRLDARRLTVGSGRRVVWITSREAVAEYRAIVSERRRIRPIVSVGTDLSRGRPTWEPPDLDGGY